MKLWMPAKGNMRHAVMSRNAGALTFFQNVLSYGYSA